LGTETIASAKLTFTNFANWDNNPNQLFVYIGATAGNGTGGATTILPGNNSGSTAGFTQTTTYFQDSVDGTTISDAFAGTGANPLYDANVGSLTVKSTSSGHTFVASPSGFDTTPDPTMIVNFGSTALTDLKTYIGSAAGGDFALLLDSDCHYFFSTGVLSITTQASAVPEPGAVVLLLTVLAGVGFS